MPTSPPPQGPPLGWPRNPPPQGPPAWLPPQPSPAPPKRQEPRIPPIGVAVLILGPLAILAAVLVGVLRGDSANSTSSDSVAAADVSADRAYIACQDFVRERLKAPATASFPGVGSSAYPTITGSGDGPYEVIGVVDAENGFGAEIRSTFDCKTSHAWGSWSDDGTTIGG